MARRSSLPFGCAPLVLLAGCYEARAQMLLHSLSDPLAVCGDGTRAAYYLEKPPADAEGGDANQTRTWIVDLMGGGWCHDEASCNKRCPAGSNDRLCTINAWPKWMPKEFTPSGILKVKDGFTLEKAYKVFVPYCTSDAHMGDSEAFNGRQFRGARVVRNVIADLQKNHGLGHLAPGQGKDLVILAGQSAGGRGAMVNLDYVADVLSYSPGKVETVGLLDSPLWLDLPSYDKEFDGFPKECQDVFSFANVTNTGTECAKTYTGKDAWKCIMGQYRIPTLKTPYFLVASQYDAFQLGQNHISLEDGQKVPAARDYGIDFATKTKALVKSIRRSWPDVASRLPNAVYSWACYNHAVTLEHKGFDGDSIGGLTIDMAFHQWLYQNASSAHQPSYEWVEECEGFACGRNCEKTSVTESNPLVV
eukprot:TRINITY_DN2878_c0_g1_i1.p1 TRINITY_DN2878_c0_g1~~TRINITY_DN2878_c0_g1_i1.p1  ORF type:complete len:419 (-),score=56.98 TRINITY_DN2878_c0_g1_i1:202-1458(-)